MNNYESVVMDYLRADRAIFVNTEFCIQINKGTNPDNSGRHWCCDAVALDFRCKEIFLCEISYGANLAGLINRLKGWDANWDRMRSALARDCFLAEQWPITPWLFVPRARIDFLKRRLAEIGDGRRPTLVPKITALEEVQPWHYSSYSRNCEDPTQATSDDVAETSV